GHGQVSSRLCIPEAPAARKSRGTAPGLWVPAPPRPILAAMSQTLHGQTDIKSREREIEDPDRFADANFPDFIPHRPPRPDKSEGGIAYDLQAPYEPKGDQPTAIAELVDGVKRDERDQVLLGVTGSGKTFSMAQVIART